MTEQQFGADKGLGSRSDNGAEPAVGSTSLGAPGRSQTSQALLGPLTLRDVVALGSVVVIFIGSVLPLFRTDYYLNLWNGFSLFFLGIGVVLPLLTGVLFLTRRFSAGVKTRIGSLSVDQFGSVVASFATAFFFLYTVSDFRWAFLIGLIGSLGLLASTVVAPWLAFFAADFAHRPETPAHPVARDVVPAVAKPAVAKPVAAKPAVAEPAVAVPAAKSIGASTDAAQTDAAQSDAAQSDAAKPDAAKSDAAKPVVAQSAVAAKTDATQTAAAKPVVVTPGAAKPGAAKPDAAKPDAAKPAAAKLDGAKPDADRSASGKSAPTPDTSGQALPGVSHPAGSNALPSNAAGQNGAAQSALAQHTAETAAAAPRTAHNPTVDTHTHARPESIGATVDPGSRHDPDHSHDAGNRQGEKAVYDAFWFAVDRKRPVFDEKTGAFLYNVEPGNWILALKDRGHDFLVQNTEGRAGVLRDLRNIERAPESE
ncbi:hypothetical protein IV500_01780 [Paeniglutamicibacter antarcticus]|uniref:Uncharacterized protein n=1 Tax=Arthrobacter terrae TaxID=2935737 RepID=A0A931CNP2_9MICC|nr:hypothetical protein [Arthrobacter terrae]MBG0738166.1 hypothetical protein [Arthrobacter terrae]